MRVGTLPRIFQLLTGQSWGLELRVPDSRDPVVTPTPPNLSAEAEGESLVDSWSLHAGLLQERVSTGCND